MSALRKALVEEGGLPGYYYDHPEVLADEHGIDAVLRTAANILGNGDRQEVVVVCDFLPRLYEIRFPDATRLAPSTVLPPLQRLLRAPDVPVGFEFA